MDDSLTLPLPQDFLSRFRTRFPHVDETVVPDLVENQQQLSQHLAERHDLTLLEAKEELLDFLWLERLTAQIAAPSARSA
ncbi:hypothetical protein [Pacificoceanicola onchidii]|uniref:hypothetical protein n=1 Tax=Pacificoceanicola onchidii TaxID=2562685 RepID=UPI0010A5CCBD|nr:hypothetical protein [Pacificoceanicola onchidii]